MFPASSSSSAPLFPLYRIAGIRAVEAVFLPHAHPPLMERAGSAAARQALDILGRAPGTTLVLAGPGNNGGDGLVLARYLKDAGRPVRVVFFGDPARLPDDARAAHSAWLAAGGVIETDLPAETDFALAVDGLFGIGLQRHIAGRLEQWVTWLNALRCPVLALDIPSGLDADTGQILGTAVRASHTATFIAAKPGLYTLDGPDHAGEVRVHPLDLDPAAARPPEGQLISPALFLSHLHPRQRNSHKGSFGSLGIIGGSHGMVGAAVLAARAGLHLGAGRVFVGLLAPFPPAVDLRQPELMLRPAERLLEEASLTALAVGPGLGQSDGALALVRTALAKNLPLLLDADALNLLAGHGELTSAVAGREAATVLTPHPAEAARLLACSVADVQADRIAACRELARRYCAQVVLKGCGSIVAGPKGNWSINPSGNPGMASAGMGDVLSGLAGALLSQGWPAADALKAAVYLHGVAADEMSIIGRGPIGLTAGETITSARSVFNRWCAGLF